MWSYWVYAEILWDIEMLAGEPAEALEILTEGYEQIERMGETFPLLSAWLAQSLYAVGRFDEAEPTRAGGRRCSRRRSRSEPRGMGALARVRARQGRFEEAERVGEGGRRVLRATPTTRPTGLGPDGFWPKSCVWPDVPTRRSPPSARRSSSSSNGRTSSRRRTREPDRET